ncbi:Telomeric repeat-binding factor 1 [Chelonia mydas]|uniref:Telomeric repeat-binding factor 1 n=1 Tax=Chelonia mydas TaxID=8469 RepID=M7B9P4_CHEMY|nr:Telomeric repeat-binding factor 1 [Chelonia mydas]
MDGAVQVEGEGSSGAPVSLELFAETEAVAAGWMLDFTCYALCRHFREGRTRDFERSRDTAQAIINGLSKVATHQMKTVYLCQFLTRISEGKTLGRRFESDQRISPLESALSIWKLLEEEQSKPDNLHEDIHRLILIQAVAVHLEKGYFKEATEVLKRLFSESESNKALRMKLALIINGNDPDLPFLQSFSYNLLIDKIKSYIDDFLKENSTNFLIKAATEEVETKRLEATMSHNKPGNIIETNNGSNLETEQRFVTEHHTSNHNIENDGKSLSHRPTRRKKQVGRLGRLGLPVAAVRCCRPMGAAGSSGQYVPWPAPLSVVPFSLELRTTAAGSRDRPNLRTQQRYSRHCSICKDAILKLPMLLAQLKINLSSFTEEEIGREGGATDDVPKTILDNVFVPTGIGSLTQNPNGQQRLRELWDSYPQNTTPQMNAVQKAYKAYMTSREFVHGVMHRPRGVWLTLCPNPGEHSAAPVHSSV